MFFEGQYSLIMPYNANASYILKKDYLYDGYVNEMHKISNNSI